ncbi:glycosyltransferase [Reyranella sp.]|uniref:glycosyltransferase n=1 Tax=Reyranella sp. TaxID=1929291 RepID=UPI002731E9F8|nr:glycosyltransferase [Reyranella sp.]MDP2376301.1 glycosyltransferase [Reyranella sp.]
MSAPTLLQIVPTLAGGGLARATLDTAQAVIAAGGSAIVASPGGAMVPDLLRLRATHIELPTNRQRLWGRLTLPRKLASSLRDARIDIVQARSPATAWIARALARRLGVKWIATLHRPFVAGDLMGRFLESRQMRADAVIAVSDHVARDARQRFPNLEDRLETISPGINADRFDPAIVRADRLIRLAGELRVPDGSHLVLCPARFGEDNGQKILIEALKRLDRDDVFCLLLGSAGQPTPFERELERAIEAAELHGRMQIGPYVDDMPAAYMLADAVVATGGSQQGFSRTLVEAQAMGRPVVAEDGGGAAETMRPGVTGWLAQAGDAAALAEALQSALSLPAERRAELARAAQEHARSHYSLAQANSRLLALYERLAAGAKAP